MPPGAPAGVHPDVRQHLYRTAKVRGTDVALFSEKIHVPLRPFFGVMAVAPPTGQCIGATPDSPPPVTGIQGSVPPWNFGGNMDSHVIRKGAKLSLPVFQNGGQMFFGDTGSVQGDGTVSGTAIEDSLGDLFPLPGARDETPAPPRARRLRARGRRSHRCLAGAEGRRGTDLAATQRVAPTAAKDMPSRSSQTSRIAAASSCTVVGSTSAPEASSVFPAGP